MNDRWKITGIRDCDVYLLCVASFSRTLIRAEQPLKKARAVGMKLNRGNRGIGIAIRHGQCLAAWGRTAVENARALTHQGCDQLRSLVLNYNLAGAESQGLGNITSLHPACGFQKGPGSDLDAFTNERCFSRRVAKPNSRGRYRLIVLTNTVGGREAIFAGPALDEP